MNINIYDDVLNIFPEIEVYGLLVDISGGDIKREINS